MNFINYVLYHLGPIYICIYIYMQEILLELIYIYICRGHKCADINKRYYWNMVSGTNIYIVYKSQTLCSSSMTSALPGNDGIYKQCSLHSMVYHHNIFHSFRHYFPRPHLIYNQVPPITFILQMYCKWTGWRKNKKCTRWRSWSLLNKGHYLKKSPSSACIYWYDKLY